jgi:predicted flap endonuclease-1-like 5' DNA nuclease
VQVREGTRFRARLGQMSISGSFIETEQVQPLGSELTLLFQLPGCEIEFVVAASVRWGAGSGMGVQFGAMRGREIYELSRFLVDKPTIPPPPLLPRSPVRAARPATPPLVRHGAAAKAAGAAAAGAAAAGAGSPAASAGSPAAETAPPAATGPEAGLAALREQVRLLDAVLAERDAQLRRANQDRVAASDLAAARAERTALEAELAAVRAERTALEGELRAMREERTALQGELQAVRAARTTLEDELRAARAAAVLSAQGPGHAEPDDLTRIPGIGPALARGLRALGVRRYDEVAALGDVDLERIARALRVSVGRIRRNDWVGHAAALAAERAGTDEPKS